MGINCKEPTLEFDSDNGVLIYTDEKGVDTRVPIPRVTSLDTLKDWVSGNTSPSSSDIRNVVVGLRSDISKEERHRLAVLLTKVAAGLTHD